MSTFRERPRRNPTHPERICWGCSLYCPAGNMRCGADTTRAAHPYELFGDDWQAADGMMRPELPDGSVVE